MSERKRAATIAPTGRLTLHEPDGRSTVAAPHYEKKRKNHKDTKSTKNYLKPCALCAFVVFLFINQYVYALLVYIHPYKHDMLLLVCFFHGLPPCDWPSGLDTGLFTTSFTPRSQGAGFFCQPLCLGMEAYNATIAVFI